MPAKTTISASPTVHAALDALPAKSDYTSWDLTREVLARHPEYGHRRAAEIAAGPPPVLERTAKPKAWFGEIQSLFDPALVDVVHGRLLILGLCELDSELQKHLGAFARSIEDELREDFRSLLALPEDDPDAYRKRFLAVLANRGKSDPQRFGRPRSQGFVAVVDGGPGLSPLAELCFRQTWNSCFTARYALAATSTFDDCLRLLARDLRGLAEQDTETVGDLQPDPATADSPWHTLLPAAAAAPGHALRDVVTRKDEPEPFESLMRALGDDSVLGVGKRFVLFAEYRGAPTSLSSAGLQKLLTSLPERVGVVVSGLPPELAAELTGAHVVHLKLPPDVDLWRGQPLKNDVPQGADRLHIAPEVYALAEACVLRDLEPPLVVGVLGGWGSGKSFVLHLLEQRIEEIRCQAVSESFPFVGHPYVIRFDAWTYAKSNLWASLMQEVFVELDRQLTLEQQLREELGLDLREGHDIWRVLNRLRPADRDRLTKTELGQQALRVVTAMERGDITERRLWRALEDARRAETKQLDDAERELRKEEQAVAATRSTVEARVADELEVAARRAAWQPALDRLQEIAKSAFEKSAGPTFEQVRDAITWAKRFVLGVRQLGWPFVAFVAVILVAGVLSRNLAPVLAHVASIGGALAAVLGPFAAAREWLDGRRTEYETRLQAELTGQDAQRAAKLESALAADRDYQAANAGAAAKRAEVVQRRQRIGLTARHDSLLDFVRQRIEGKFYEDKLGLLHQVQVDLGELTDSLLPADGASVEELFPRGQPRVVLLVDDLDRCPPDKVVEVLEAAQLLVKTRLFVVVLAMDVRYITRALEKEYAGVLVRDGEPSGLDYIEKIVQIPYRMRYASPRAVSGYVRSQMEIEAPAVEHAAAGRSAAGATEATEATEPDADEQAASDIAVRPATRTPINVLPTRVLKFAPEEYRMIAECCSAVDVTPRTMKRLTNVFKLMKILWYRQGQQHGPSVEVKRAMLALLSLAAQFPEPMRRLLRDLELQFRRGKDRSREIGPVLTGLVRRGARHARFPDDWLRIIAALQDSAFFPPDLTLADLAEANLNLVSSFSFVSETDAAREAALRSDDGEGESATPDLPDRPPKPDDEARQAPGARRRATRSAPARTGRPGSRGG